MLRYNSAPSWCRIITYWYLSNKANTPSSRVLAFSLRIILFQDSLHCSFSLQAIIAFALTHPATAWSACGAIHLRPMCLSEVKHTKKVYNSKLFVSCCTPFYYLYLTEPVLCKHFSIALSREEITSPPRSLRLVHPERYCRPVPADRPEHLVRLEDQLADRLGTSAG